MAQSYVQLPDDAANTGKKVATRTRTQGADTVHDHVFAINEILTELPAGTQNIGDVDVVSLPALPAGNNNVGDVDVASIAAGDNNIGNVDVVSLPALVAGTANIGDVDVLTLPAIPAGNNNIGDVDVASQPARVATTDTITAKLATDKLMNGTTALTPLFAAIAASTSGDNTLATNSNGGLKIRVLALMLIAGAAGNIYFTSDAGGTVIFGGSTNKINLVPNTGFVLPFNPLGWFETAANHDVVMNASSTGPFSGGLVYVEV